MDAFYLGKPNSSMGIFQKNMIDNIPKNQDVEELHIVTSQDSGINHNGESHIVHYCPESLLTRGLCFSRINEKVKPDVFFYTFNLIPPMERGDKSLRILQNHDWSHSQFSETLKQKLGGAIYEKIHRNSAKKAEVNLSNSGFTSKETMKHSGEESLVIYHDADPLYKESDSIGLPQMDEVSIQELEYIIYAGRVYPKYKNISSLLVAFKTLHDQNKNLKLVIVHSDSFRPEDEELIRKIGSSIIALKGVQKLVLKALYHNSLCMVYPSLYEGFGAPILEAQNSGTPVIAFDSEPMTEVGGTGATYFNMKSGDLLEKISAFIEETGDRKDRIQKGYANTRRFNWEDTARKTVQAFNV